MTETQAKLLTYIRQCGAVTPTYREMAEHLGWASHGGVKAVLDALIKMGHIKRRKGADRGLTVVKEKAAWQPIETAKRDELQPIQLYNGVEVTTGAAWMNGWADWMHDWMEPQPTHWAPLLEAPQ